MKPMKPAHSPAHAGITMAIAMAGVGILGTALAVGLNAPAVVILLGVLFVVFAIAQGAYSFLSAARERPAPCPACGAKAPAGADLCPRCGSRLS